MAKIKGLISPKEAKQLNDAFTERCELISKEITKRPDNRSSWFSLEDIKAYLEYAEKQARENGHEMNGIRIYCGAYSTTEVGVGYSTSFIVPTARTIDGKDGGGGNGDIPDGDGLNFGNNGWPPNANYPQQ
ncbi:hypothetical protein MWU58_09635 [Flavobacteriaceae bacterium S0825]|uniref:hypothetical protein n=1 Tax=Gaetbulibacter sp. S0825 TaxID=2720084 RepID=UPI0014306F1C|nr:hypothetical protein [Gaetbulibacter sp. S0825]MCK0109554.1 hypothetical protein [Flavobacteriaceae bacterium S0825]NIX65187.1 hypothetical protein [Gaetbulibacter sp. S0825]